MDHTLSAKTAKYMSLENLYEYGNSSDLLTAWTLLSRQLTIAKVCVAVF